MSSNFSRRKAKRTPLLCLYSSPCLGRDCRESPHILEQLKDFTHLQPPIYFFNSILSLQRYRLKPLNCLCSMFPPPGSDDFFNHFNPHQEDFIQQDLILGQASLEGSHLTNQNNDEGNRNNIESGKKISRKEIERQRRQHMSKLNASLRSLLPFESIKGKCSVSDHIHEAEKHITHLKKNIQDLNVKRDKLKNFPDSEAFDHGNTSSENCLTNCVSVHVPNCGGVEIVISGGLRKESLLSRVLKVVVEEGLDVVGCVSSQTDEGLFHTIQCEVTDPTCVDLNGLQQKLNYVITSPRYNSDQ